MTIQIPIAFLAAAGGNHDSEETLVGVILHHLSNQDLQDPVLASWGLSKAVVMMFLAAAFLMLFLGWFLRNSRISNGAPTGITNAIEALAVFVRDEIAIMYMGSRHGRFFAPYLLTLFFFILTCNLMGMIPGSYAPTSNLNVTGALAALTLALIVTSGVIVLGPIGYIKHMIPPGVPIVIAPLLIVIELLGTFVKPIALTIRLAANMTAGHIVILVMLSFVFIFKSVFAGIFLSVPMAVAIGLLEIIVALIQAYVFTLLSAIFVGMVVRAAH